MSGILDVLLQNIAPIFLVAGMGYWLRRRLDVQPRPLSKVVFNVLSPCLVFASLVNSRLQTEELAQLAAFAISTILIMGALAFVVSRLLNFSRAASVTLILVVMFVNGGNYGLTLNQLRFGDAGLSRAIVYYVVSTMLVYTVGVFIASTGKLTWKDSLRRLVRVPAVYAVVAALIVYTLQIELPAPLMRGIEVAAAGAVPVMIIVLGMQLASVRGVVSWRFAGLASFLRLIVGALVAVGVANLLGLQGLTRSVSILEASMPTAVITTVLATEFEVLPPVVTSVVVLTTLLSPITISLLIQLLGL